MQALQFSESAGIGVCIARNGATKIDIVEQLEVRKRQ